ncbi:hypothetical protein CASFOL_034161 [Castilleja foliolosa]|uniref:RING-type domain-containing protein n=1 Tax=Castilleja foliolosa TaxID=1961234 RepID=A0ABD3BWR1_9LAMI
MSATVEVVGPEFVEDLGQNGMEENCAEAVEEINIGGCETNLIDTNNHHGICAICLNKIVLQETALAKGCEHAYCVTCILRWASCKKQPTCPQCKTPFNFLNIHRSLDGSLHDYMFEESVCLLLRASWFNPLVEVEKEELDKIEDYHNYDYDDDEDEFYFGSSSSLRIGNRRWGDNGYVSAGRQEVRPIRRPCAKDADTGPSRQPKKETPNKEIVGRRAKRALKREAANKAAAEKHQQTDLVAMKRN